MLLTATLRLLTFDLDDTLFPCGDVVKRAMFGQVGNGEPFARGRVARLLACMCPLRPLDSRFPDAGPFSRPSPLELAFPLSFVFKPNPKLNS